MVKTRIGIRYCGGCNPHYERVELIQRVQSLAGDRFIFLRYDQQDLDGLIALNGCLRACGVKDRDRREVPLYSMTEKGDVDRLMEWLYAFDPERTRK